MADFAHLHLHTEYSLLDGANRIGPLLAQVKALGMKHCAVTDHGAMYGVVAFFEEAQKQGIHPVIGCEAYLTEDMDVKAPGTQSAHLILLCENNIGYQNLTKLISEAWIRGHYYRPRIDLKLLEQHHEGLIAMSACLSGEVPRLLLEGRYETAKAHALEMLRIMGEGNYFLEIMDHGLTDQRRVLPLIKRLSDETGIPLVATNDCHYLRREDAKAQEVLMCIQTGKTLDDTDRMRMDTEELYVKSPEEMEGLFAQYPGAVTRTVEIAERCEVTFDFDTIHLPHYDVPEGETPLSLLTRLCEEGLAQRYQPMTQEAQDRLSYELDTISTMGYVDYFLITWDFIRFAKDNGIMVGPGRGSGAGSIVAYTLGITALDPLKYNLLFERFLNPERISMPDLDIDFCYERRQEVIDYVTRKYGSDHVAQIITFGTMAARAVVRDVGRALNFSYAEVDAVAKMIPFALDMTLEKGLGLSNELRQRYESEERVRELIDTSMALEGLPRHASTHAAGVLITHHPVTDYVPLQKNDDVITTQFPMGTLEKMGLLKMDFLGLRTLTVIRDTLDMLKGEGIDMRPEDIPMDDPAVYEMISQGDTDGVFQLEGGGMRTFLSNMKPQNFEDIIAAISLYRPGPMESIPRYIECKQDPGKVQYLDPSLEPILSVTHGCMVYQEQVMQIVRDVAGYSLGRSDLMRRAMSKKKHDVMAKEREYFIHGLEEDGRMVVPGAVRNGVPEQVASRIFDEMSAFASYAFNKSHAAAYGVVAAQTAYLKVHHPVQFMAAIMNSVTGNATKIAVYIQYCRKHHIPVLPPDVNQSMRRFSVGRDAQNTPGIRFGMGAVKHCGNAAVDAIVAARTQGGPFASLYDFCARVNTDHVHKRVVDSLIRAGAFDSTGASRAQMLEVYVRVLEGAAQVKKRNIAGQVSLFDAGLEEAAPPSMPDMPPFPRQVQLKMEREVTGVYITGHPLDEFAEELEQMPFSTRQLEELSDLPDMGMQYDGQSISVGGILSDIRTKATRSGNLMAFLVLEDLTGQMEVLVFPKVYDRYLHQLTIDAMLVLHGKLSIREDEAPKLLLDSCTPLGHRAQAEDAQKKTAPAKPQKLYLRLPTEGRIPEVSSALGEHPGETQVIFFMANNSKKLLAPDSLRVQINATLMARLNDALGADNVKVK